VNPTRASVIMEDGKFSDIEVFSPDVYNDKNDSDYTISSPKLSGMNPMYRNLPKTEPPQSSSLLDSKKKSSWFPFQIFSSEPKDDNSLRKPLLESQQKAVMEKIEQESESAEMFEVVNSIKAATGLFDKDPDDSFWLKLDAVDHVTGVRVPRGLLCFSVQLWPKDKAIVMPVGSGNIIFNFNKQLLKI